MKKQVFYRTFFYILGLLILAMGLTLNIYSAPYCRNFPRTPKIADKSSSGFRCCSWPLSLQVLELPCHWI